MTQLPEGVVKIGNNEYHTVAKRANDFRNDERFTGFALITDVKIMDDMKVVVQCVIRDSVDRIIATGHSEEFRQSSKVNRTSALENAETSAIGRALASLGIGGTEFASANEVAEAINQQQLAKPEQVAAIQQYMISGVVTAGQFLTSFGHSDPTRLFSVEAERIINAINLAQQGE